MPRGPVLSVAQTWSLAQAWYGRRMDPAYHGRTLEEIQALFAEQGLVGPFWQSGGGEPLADDRQEEIGGTAEDASTTEDGQAPGQAAERRRGRFPWWSRQPGKG